MPTDLRAVPGESQKVYTFNDTKNNHFGSLSIRLLTLNGLVIISTQDRGGRNDNFFLRKTHNPSKFPLKFSDPIRKSSRNFITQHVQAFYLLIRFFGQYLRTQLKTGLKINI